MLEAIVTLGEAEVALPVVFADALEGDGGLSDLGEKVGAELQKSLGCEPNIDDLDQSELLRMAFRLGMQNGAPGVIDDLVAVKKEPVEQL
ncbi:hypothetical protein SAMN05421752_12714 [Natronorubrum thiooxidans]|uniref:DUF8115 domain-containing protein n=2 Tax=Natronorubrum thiooxidans TaxID=308853 RepID=A0A1N7H6H8_9EURY|nr:hypothetical protein SAMN05421752_12714 [Natronorubrum thiooxidans]